MDLVNVLIIGSGGREHALAWKIRQSKSCGNLYVAPGNAGTSSIAGNVNIRESDFKALGAMILETGTGLVIVGPEAPLASGITDYLSSLPGMDRLLIIGPDKHGAMLESSKDFAKQFMRRYHIPTAKSRSFNANEIKQAIRYVSSHPLPVVIKADGLAAGKGVIICNTSTGAREAVTGILQDKMFGEAGNKVVVEEYLNGIELSVFAVTDGRNYVILPEAKDYKRIGENDSGPNTGGMGAVSPVKFAGPEFMKKVEEKIIKPTVLGLQEEKIDYRGFIFAGLMNVQGEPYVIEYNVRMGDPESQVVFPRLKSDLLELLIAAASKKLSGTRIEAESDTALAVVLASAGYPGTYEKGKPISGLESRNDALIFHAGTINSGSGRIQTNGGRILAVTGKGKDIEEARITAYTAIKHISWEGMQFRKDIGMDLISLR
ncbi:MAG TPA: phosphoribosylamine--glycine ligase [Cyclobacteriaceae bacterium]|nr:phosphoribosylamine--glycine ligase [Cyclobacteriaceae bacterium]